MRGVVDGMTARIAILRIIDKTFGDGPGPDHM